MYTIMPYRRNTDVMNPFALADSFLRPFFGDFHTVNDAFRVDVKDTGDAWQLTAELPGVKPEDISLKAENDVLTIEADMNTERKQEEGSYLYTERRSGHMARSFNLEGVDQNAISANYENGVLCVKLPKEAPVEKKTARTIAIEGVKPAEHHEDGENNG